MKSLLINLVRNYLIIISVILVSLSSCGKKYPYQNPGLSSEERAKDLLSRLTIDEKVTLMCDASEAIPRLGIKKFNWWSEALHGLANNENVTVFPEPIGMAASFDDDLVYRIFNAVSDETRAKYNEAIQQGKYNSRFLSLSVWTPNINIFRDPRWGRGQETYGEDPYLTSRMGISVVKGLQGPDSSRYRKLLACAKHFAVHSGPEWSRHSLNINNLDPLDLYETYLPAFKALVQEADVREVMCAYQRLEDEPCCGNSQLLQKILRDDWGFKYLVVSDCDAIADFYNGHKFSPDATHAVAKSVPAGTDVECAWMNYSYKHIPDAVAKGLLKEEDIDKSVIRLLVGRFDLGEMDDDAIVPWTRIPPSVINNEEHRKLALEMSRETMTLLQNKNNILPLSKSARKIALIGPNADNERVLWGNYNGTPVNTITILDGIKSKLSADRILYDEACDIIDDKILKSLAPKCSIDGKQGFKATYWNSNDMSGDIVAEQQHEAPLHLATEGVNPLAPGVQLEGFSAKFETEFIPAKTDELTIKCGAAGSFQLLINEDTVKNFEDWRTLISKTSFKAEKGKKYKIEIFFKQLYTWQAAIEFDFGTESEQNFSGLLNKIKGIDTVIFVGGLSNILEGEEMPVSFPGFKGGDRTDIELPSVQRDCINLLKQAGKKVILVNLSGSAIGFVPETKNCEAILQAWYGGESGGQAVADVLFGDYNPSGKLPVTFYKNVNQLPDFEDYSMKNRTYRFMSDPLFPFGFGLSYTTFTTGDARIDHKTAKPGETVDITIPVSNTGKREGTEIVQVYIRKSDSQDGSLRTLKGFQRVNLGAGETKEITISLPGTAFEFYDRSSGKMEMSSGEYEIWYGSSSATKDLKKQTIMIL
jgi:beta-glucosidase